MGGKARTSFDSFYDLTFICDLDLHPTRSNGTSTRNNGTSAHQEKQFAKSVGNPCINAEAMAQTSSIFDHLTFNFERDRRQLEQLFKWYFYSLGKITVPFLTMHKCRSNGLDKLNFRRFDYLTFKCDLDLQPTSTNISIVDVSYFEIHA